MRSIIISLGLFLLLSCRNEFSADQIIQRSIEVAGGELYEQAEIKFEFRNRLYKSKRAGGLFELVRIQEDSLGTLRDVLSNEGVRRFRNEKEVFLPDSIAPGVAAGVNSVHYFVQLPFGLNDPGVQKELVGEDIIRGQGYYEIKVTFDTNVKSDHEDIYLYWVNKETFTIDFLAYRFFVSGGGIRFRVAVDPRQINGIRFVDYLNYRTEDLSVPLTELDDLYLAGELEKVSEIRNKILNVKINSAN